MRPVASFAVDSPTRFSEDLRAFPRVRGPAISSPSFDVFPKLRLLQAAGACCTLWIASRRLHAFASGAVLKKLGKYEVLGELGRGAFGIVYRAKDPVINRMVALKTLTNAVTEDPKLLERFYREAQSAGSLQHPNIVTIYDLGEESGTPFIAMELVDGPNLSEVIARRSTLPMALKLAYSVQACRAFDYAHKRGIIHRDIKPGNVMVMGDDTVKVVDFGIARVLEGSRTQTGTLIGTFAYMAPELFHGTHASERTDIWSFGVLMYELLAYQPPFSAGSPAALMKSICHQEPTRLRELVRDCPEDLDTLVHRAIAKSEAERYASMEDMLLELEPIWKRLQTECVSDLLGQARHLTEQGEYVSARDLLRQVLRLDPTSLSARALSEKVNVELTRLAVRPKAQQCVEKGRALLQQGNLQAASSEADSALRMDSKFEAARELLQEIGRERERLQVVHEHLQAAKQKLVEGLPDEAEELVAKVREMAPSHPQLSGIESQIVEQKDQRKRRLQLQDGLRQARLLWAQQRFNECADVLLSLQQEFPGEPDVSRLLETVREEQAEQAKREKLVEARALLASREYQKCIAVLEKLREDFPGDNEIRTLLDLASGDLAEQKKREQTAEARRLLSAGHYRESLELLGRLQQEWPNEGEIRRLIGVAREGQAEADKREKLAAARDLLAAQRFSDALAVLDPLIAADASDSAVLKLRSLVLREQQERARSEVLQRELQKLKELASRKAYADLIQCGEDLLHQYPGQADVLRLIEFARGQQAQIESEIRLGQAKREIEGFLQAGQYSEAIAAGRAALDRFAGDPDISALLERAQESQREAMVHEQLERSVRDIKFKINRGQLTEAKELAQEALDKLGPDTDVRQLLWSAELEYNAREKKRRQQQQLESVRALIRTGKLAEASAALAEITKTGDFDPLDPRLDELRGEITGAREASANPTMPVGPAKADAVAAAGPDREYVVADGSTLPVARPSETVSPQKPQPAVATPQPSAPPVRANQPANAARVNEVTPAVIDRAAQMLARHIGPISAILAKRAAQQSDSLRTFYRLLAEHLDDESDRVQFLEDAGFPEL